MEINRCGEIVFWGSMEVKDRVVWSCCLCGRLGEIGVEDYDGLVSKGRM